MSAARSAASAAATVTAPALDDGVSDAPGLYLHLPFCSAICPYCDFSVLKGSTEQRAAFVTRLRHEIRLWGERPALGAAPFDTVYLGGGTPSLLAPEPLAAILDAASPPRGVAADAWLAMEANPEDVTPAAIAAWRALGVRTLTLGVQAFDDAALRFLGRRHDGGQARAAVAAARDAGFDSVGVDLIYGLPGQSPEAWRRELETAVTLAPQHLSCYQLTIHEGTPFGFRAARGRLREMAEPAQAVLFRLTHEILPAHGFEAYEVSNFAATPAHRSRHNRKYWTHAPYLGLGPSAHSFDGTTRWWNQRRIGPWQRAIDAHELPVDGRETLGAGELALEHLLLGLRRREGVDLARLRALGIDLVLHNRELLHRLTSDGLLVHHGERLLPTLAGWAVADGLAAAFALGPSSLPRA
jgi:oxygen-independent coproporphyrinogen-3 oxidase